jgi:tRNA-2-methylthio-N6-dimethylallyladenosine synthase
MGPDGYRSLPEALNGLDAEPRLRRQLAVLDLHPSENYQGLEQQRSAGPSAWVPVQRGCDHRCTFCIVPYVRGGEKNRDASEVVSEVRGLAESGVTEVTLLGQTVNSYAWKDVSFPRLLRDVARVDGIRRVRFMSPHPNDVSPELIEVMVEESAVCEHLHLPAQAGNDRTLKRMLRRYTVESLLEKVELVRGAIPDIALSTDIIVAFPGETDEEFRDTLKLMHTVRFDEAFTYKYSPREGTPATRLPAEDFLDGDDAQARLEELIDVSRTIQAEINRAAVGQIAEVLIESAGRDQGQVRGRTRGNKVVVFDGDATRIGEYTYAVLERTTGATFAGSEVFLLATLRGGGKGCITATGNVNVRAIRALIDAFPGAGVEELSAPVVRVNADGTLSRRAPACASFR